MPLCGFSKKKIGGCGGWGKTYSGVESMYVDCGRWGKSFPESRLLLFKIKKKKKKTMTRIYYIAHM